MSYFLIESCEAIGYLQASAECARYLKTEKTALGLWLFSSWLKPKTTQLQVWDKFLSHLRGAPQNYANLGCLGMRWDTEGGGTPKIG